MGITEKWIFISDMIRMKTLLLESVVKLTHEDAQEVMHKIGVLADNADLQDDYGITPEQANELVQSIPHNGGEWKIPDWGVNAVRGEMKDHIQVMRDIAMDAYNSNERGQFLKISKQAKRLTALFGL